MIDLTVDTCVLVDASQKGNPTYARSAFELLREYETDNDLWLVIDEGGFVRHEYDENINASMFASAWLKRISTRIRKVRISPLPKGLRTRLDEAHFSIPDRRFVQVALASEAKLIVTREPDFSAEVKRILRQEVEIRVYEPAEALAYIRSIDYQEGDPPIA